MLERHGARDAAHLVHLRAKVCRGGAGGRAGRWVGHVRTHTSPTPCCGTAVIPAAHAGLRASNPPRAHTRTEQPHLTLSTHSSPLLLPKHMLASPSAVTTMAAPRAKRTCRLPAPPPSAFGAGAAPAAGLGSSGKDHTKSRWWASLSHTCATAVRALHPSLASPHSLRLHGRPGRRPAQRGALCLFQVRSLKESRTHLDARLGGEQQVARLAVRQRAHAVHPVLALALHLRLAGSEHGPSCPA